MAFSSKSTRLKNFCYYWYQTPLWAFKMLYFSLETYFLASYLWVKSMHFPCLVPSKQSRRANTTIEKKIFSKRKWKVLESHLFGFWHPKKRNHICSSKKEDQRKIYLQSLCNFLLGTCRHRMGRRNSKGDCFWVVELPAEWIIMHWIYVFIDPCLAKSRSPRVDLKELTTIAIHVLIHNI